MRVTYDIKAKAAYITLIDVISPGEATRQIHATDDIILDLDDDGHVIGIELLSLSRLHPSLDPVAREER